MTEDVIAFASFDLVFKKSKEKNTELTNEWKSLNKDFNDLFPTPERFGNAPLDKDFDDFPIIKSGSESYKIEISRSKISFYFIGEGNDKSKKVKVDFKKKCFILFNFYTKRKDLFSRVGIHYSFFYNDTQYTETISNLFKKNLSSFHGDDGKLNDVEVSFITETKIANILAHNHTWIEKGTSPLKKEGVMIARHIHTLPDDVVITKDTIKKIFTEFDIKSNMTTFIEVLWPRN